jgi:hypothetical protein
MLAVDTVPPLAAFDPQVSRLIISAANQILPACLAYQYKSPKGHCVPTLVPKPPSPTAIQHHSPSTSAFRKVLISNGG